ncbi:bifunctional protein FolD 1, mitochondrial-like protein isoform X1, partial [Tanacetum coccineum]
GSATVALYMHSRRIPEGNNKCSVFLFDVGVPNLVLEDINSSHGPRVTGDVCYEEAMFKASAITPVPGGIGLLPSPCYFPIQWKLLSTDPTPTSKINSEVKRLLPGDLRPV